MSFPPPPASDAAGNTAGTRADVLLREALFVVEPLARLLVSHGVNYTTFAQALKRVFLDAAEAELKASDRKVTDSAISLLSGVHRKDVRAMTRSEARDPAAEQALSTASMVFYRWMATPECVDANGEPKPIRLRSNDASETTFERLSQSVTKDFHARSVLDELIRLGLAVEAEGWVRLDGSRFVPSRSFADAASFFGSNVHDHVASAAENLTRLGQGQPAMLLEQAVFADGLSQSSANSLNTIAVRLWRETQGVVYAAALERVNADAALPEAERSYRFKVGGYAYAAPFVSFATSTVDGPSSTESGSTTSPERVSP